MKPSPEHRAVSFYLLTGKETARLGVMSEEPLLGAPCRAIGSGGKAA